ncbi:hypothetical protein [Terrisporobacter vanillatitrophus]|uniref:hypothetical protein n=1 Tax=Terrisporobacter vanillatitrophus TaxID=3058402 RepID=UPI003366B552
MKESKQKICKIPGCNKEVYDSKLLFCGEHERAFQEFKKIAGAVGGVGMAALAFIAKSITNKKS